MYGLIVRFNQSGSYFDVLCVHQPRVNAWQQNMKILNNQYRVVFPARSTIQIAMERIISIKEL